MKQTENKKIYETETIDIEVTEKSHIEKTKVKDQLVD